MFFLLVASLFFGMAGIAFPPLLIVSVIFGAMFVSALRAKANMPVAKAQSKAAVQARKDYDRAIRAFSS